MPFMLVEVRPVQAKAPKLSTTAQLNPKAFCTPVISFTEEGNTTELTGEKRATPAQPFRDRLTAFVLRAEKRR
jgi:hypothetical protein